MGRYYDTQEEYDANKEGHNDQQRHRINYEHDKYSDEPEDIAYWQGRQDEERKMRIEEEERQMEEDRQQREFERQLQEERERAEYEEYLQIEAENADQQSVSDFDALMEREENDMQSQDDERPYTEEELFNDILKDEREENEME